MRSNDSWCARLLVADASTLASAAPRRALVVEDDVAILDALCAALEGEGYEVEGVGTLQAARAALDVRRPDVLLLDLMLHGQLADSLLEELGGRPHSAPPTLLVSASPDARVIAKRYGIGHIAKPFDLDQLFAAVAVAIELDVRPVPWK